MDQNSQDPVTPAPAGPFARPKVPLGEIVADLRAQLAARTEALVQLEIRVQELEAVVSKLGAPVVEATRRLSAGTVARLVTGDAYTSLEVLADWAGGGIHLARGQVIRADKYRVVSLVESGLQVGEVK